MAALTDSVQRLFIDQRQLRAHLGHLENQFETALRASARASAQAGAVQPLRQDVRALRDEVVEQGGTLAALTKTVQSLRRQASAAAVAKEAPAKQPAAKAAAKTGKALAKATKTTTKTTTGAKKVAKAAKKQPG